MARPIGERYRHAMPPEAPIREKVRTAEVIAALSLATDLGTELPLEHGLHSTLFAIRLCERLGVDTETAFQAYYGCLLFHVGCTTDADIAAELFDEGMLREHWAPVMFGSQAQTMLGIMRALASRDARPPMRAVKAVSRLPKAVRSYHRHLNAMCEVAQMLTRRLGLPASVRELFGHLTERWDGKGDPAGLRGIRFRLLYGSCMWLETPPFNACSAESSTPRGWSRNGPDMHSTRRLRRGWPMRPPRLWGCPLMNRCGR